METFCDCNINNWDIQPDFCKNGAGINGVYCFGDYCKYLSYNSVENEISFVGDLGIV